MGLNSSEFDSLQRRRAHAAHAVRFAVASTICFTASLMVWPDRRGLLLLCLGYMCLRISWREGDAERRLR